MESKKIHCIVVLLTLITLLINGIYYNYSTEIGNVTIITTIHGKGDDFMYTYLRVIVPKEVYHEEKTLNAILWHIKKLYGRQNWVTIIVYDSMNCLEHGESYISHTFGM